MGIFIIEIFENINLILGTEYKRIFAGSRTIFPLLRFWKYYNFDF